MYSLFRTAPRSRPAFAGGAGFRSSARSGLTAFSVTKNVSMRMQMRIKRIVCE